MSFSHDRFLKILIDIGIAAVVASVFIQYGYPYLSEVSRSHMDSVRIADTDRIERILSGALVSGTGFSLLSPHTVYVSLPSDTPDCSDIHLPTLSVGWRYRCVSANRLRHIDGSGWIPFDFRGATFSGASFDALPIDPKNTLDNAQYYTFVVGDLSFVRGHIVGRPTWTLFAKTESIEQYRSKSSHDDGYDPILYETGTNLSLLQTVRGFAGYWPFDSTYDDFFTPDMSGKGNPAKLVDSPTLVSGIIGQALHFDGKHSYLTIGNPPAISRLSDGFTVSAWVRLNSNFTGNPRWISKSNTSYTNQGFMMGYWDNRVQFIVGNGTENISVRTGVFTLDEYHLITGAFDSHTHELKLYVDGVLRVKDRMLGKMEPGIGNIVVGSLTGTDYWYGDVDDLRIYDRALGVDEIATLYASVVTRG